jgi:hypothetical protein
VKALVIKLLFFVIGFELLIIAGASIACFKLRDDGKECTGEQITGMLNSIASKSFALYAAEK